MKILLAICIVLLFTSCNTNVKPPQPDTILADTFLPKDSLAFYFPLNSFSNQSNVDSFVQNWYSSTLYSFKEPLLSQRFVGHSIYRSLWLRSFHRPVVFTFHKKDGQVWLQTKILDKPPRFHDERISGVQEEDQEKYIKEGFFVDTAESDFWLRTADRKANIIYNEIISLSNKEWNRFEQILTGADYWELPTNIVDGNKDGAAWIIEAHLKNRYHLVDYHNPINNEFAKAGLFLISLSGLKEEVY